MSGIIGRMATVSDHIRFPAVQMICPADNCHVGLQRTPTGTILDGLTQHAEFCHPDLDPNDLIAEMSSRLAAHD